MKKESRTKKNPKAIRYKLKAKNGFTLIELMVASSIIIIVMVISIGAVLSIVDANRKAQSLNSVITNLNFAVESMVRDMREGKNFCQGTSIPCNLPYTISFFNSSGDQVTYFIPSGKTEIDKT